MTSRTMFHTEEARQRATLTLAITGWTGSLVLTIARVMDIVPVTWGVVVIPLIGVAIAASLVRSRMLLTETISDVFVAGLRTSLVLQANVTRRAVVIEADEDGTIVTAENSDIIGWPLGELVGKAVEELVPDRYLRAHRAGWQRYQERTGPNGQGVTLVVPALCKDRSEKMVRVSVTHLGNLLVATLTPTSEDDAPTVIDSEATSVPVPA